MNKLAPHMSLPRASDTAALSGTDAISASECVSVHAEVLRTMSDHCYIERFVPLCDDATAPEPPPESQHPAPDVSGERIVLTLRFVAALGRYFGQQPAGRCTAKGNAFVYAFEFIAHPRRMASSM